MSERRRSLIEWGFVMGDMKSDLPATRESKRSVTAKQAAPVADYVPYSAYPASEREGSSFGSVSGKLLRQWRLIGAVFLGVSVVGVGFTLMQTPRYSATALLQINPAPDQIVPEKQSSAGRSDTATVDSEIEVLKSPWLAARLADELKLSQDPEWAGKEQAKAAEGVQLVELSPETQAENGFGANVTSDAIPLGMAGRDVANAKPDPHVSNALVAAVGEALDIRRRGLSYVVEVTAQAQSPDRAAEMANGLSNIYLRSLTEARYDASEKANGWLEDRLGELKLEVERKQAAVQAYRARADLLTAQGVSLVEQQLAQVQSSLLQTRAQYAQKNAEYRLLSDISESGKTVATMNSANDAMRDLRDKEAALAQRIADLQSRYGPSHPALVQALEEKAALDLRIKEEMARATAKAKVEAEALAARLNIEETELALLRGGLVNENFDQVRLEALQTDAEAAQSVYESFSAALSRGCPARNLDGGWRPPALPGAAADRTLFSPFPAELRSGRRRRAGSGAAGWTYRRTIPWRRRNDRRSRTAGWRTGAGRHSHAAREAPAQHAEA